MRHRALWLVVGFATLTIACQGRQDVVAQASATESPASPATVTPVADKTVDDVLAAYVAARGGKDKLAAVKSVRMTGIMAGGRIKGLPVTAEKKRPDKYRRVVDDPEGRMVSGFDGHTGWQQGPEGLRQLPPPALPRLRRTADIDPPLVNPGAKGYKAQLLGKQKEGTGEAYVVSVTFDDGEQSTYSIDTKSNLLVKAREKVATSEGPREAVVTLQDYRPSGGVLWPFKQVIATPAMTQTFTWNKIEVNPTLDDSLFAVPKQ
jgi:outer membrane lipoprotein-sorting protein